MIWMLAHIVGYLTSTRLLVAATARHIQLRRARSHDRCLERIARLEIELGIGLDWGREFFETRSTPEHEYARRQCWMCKNAYEPSDYPYLSYGRNRPPLRDALLRSHLCAACEEKSKAEIAAL